MVYHDASKMDEITDDNGLPESQGYVPGGMFLGWIIENGLYNQEELESSEESIDKFRKRELSGPQLLASDFDGKIDDEILNEQGIAFGDYYFDSRRYYDDFEEHLAKGLKTKFHVLDTWANYDAIKNVIDKRYAEWKRQFKSPNV